MTKLSVVLPTFNEGENVAAFLRAVQGELAGIDAEYLVIDDDSSDNTAQEAAMAGARVIVRKNERGLGTAVVRGIQEARGEFVVVMDADFQHPAHMAQKLLLRAEKAGADLVVGSRYVADGSDGAFNALRRTISRGAALLSHLALPPVRKAKLTDPMSGLFLVRKEAVDLDALQVHGYKVMLEIIGRSDLGRIEEVGYAFGTRNAGESKLGAAVMWQYLVHLAILGWSHVENRRMARFAAVGVTGVIVNLGLLYLLTDVVGLFYLVSAAISIEASILSNFFLNDHFTFRDRQHGHKLERLARFNAVSLVALGINLSVLYLLTSGLGIHYLASEAIAIVVSFGANYLGNLHWTYGGLDRFRMRTALTRMVPWLPLVAIIIGSGMLYFDDLDRPDEIYFDEHYYISVAYQYNAGILEDPCWLNDKELPHRPLNFEHPPLAKRIIAWSVDLGDDGVQPFQGCRTPDGAAYATFTTNLREDGNQIAWRAPSAIFGIATVAFAGLTAGRLFQSPLAGALAAGFVAVDGVVFTSSRMAILDIFATGFTMAAFWAATHANKKGIWGAATLLALGFACKYTAAFAGIGVLATALYVHHRVGRLNRRVFDQSLVAFVIMPVIVLVASYGPWWRLWIDEHGFTWAVRHWFDVLIAGISWAGSVQSDHPYATPPIEWFALERPVFYYAMWNVGGQDGMNRYIYGMGNPAVWWAAAAAVLYGLVEGIRSLAQRLQISPVSIASLAVFVAYAAFVALPRESFLFYMTILVPMLAVALAGALAKLYQWKWGAIPVGLAAGAAVYVFVLYLPILRGDTISAEEFKDIIHFLPWTRS